MADALRQSHPQEAGDWMAMERADRHGGQGCEIMTACIRCLALAA